MRRRHPLTAGAGVRVPAIDEDGPADAVSEVLAVERHRGGDDLIGRKDSSDWSAALGDDQRKIQQSRFLDAAMQTGGAKADGRCNTLGVVLAHADLRIEGWPEG